MSKKKKEFLNAYFIALLEKKREKNISNAFVYMININIQGRKMSCVKKYAEK